MTITDLRGFEQQEEETEQRRFAYVRGLDGLRGLAVMAVLFYHLDVSWMGEGGPVGVEVFFVISGFLITTLLIIERQNTDRISIKGFWNRRVRRLAPALIAMIGVVVVWTMLPEPIGPSAVERGSIRGDGIASLVYSSNWWYIASGQSYFARFGSPSPFQHTWSLAIEEQFYLVVAMGLALGFGVWATTRKRWVVLSVVGVGLGAAWMMFLTRMGDLVAEGLWPFGIDPESLPGWAQTFFNLHGDGDPSRVYYGTDTRIQAVLVGVALAFILDRVDLKKLPHLLVELGGLAALAALGVLLVFIPRGAHWLYYGGFLLIDLITAMTIVCLMSGRRTVARDTMSWRPLAFIGVLSYGLYVWHFPLFLIMNDDRMPVEGWLLQVLRMAVLFVLAYCSFRFFEQPLRKRGLPTKRSRWIAGAAVLAVVAGLLFFTAPPPDAVAGGTGAEAGGELNSAPTGNRPVVMVAGDSQAYSFGGGVYAVKADEKTNMQVRLSTQLGCGITDADYIIGGKPQKQGAGCANWQKRWSDALNKINPKATIVMAWSWEIYDRRVDDGQGGYTEVKVGTPEWSQLMKKSVEEAITVLTAKGGKVVLATMPCIDFEAATKKHATTEPDAPRRVNELNKVLLEVAREKASSGVVYIDVNKLLCPDGTHYKAQIDGVQMSDDGVHFSKQGAGVLWTWMAPQLQKLTGAKS